MKKPLYEMGLFRDVECQLNFATIGRFVEVKGKNYRRFVVGEPTMEIVGVGRVVMHYPDLSDVVWTGIRGYVAGAVLLKDGVPMAVIGHGRKMKPGDTLRFQNEEKP